MKLRTITNVLRDAINSSNIGVRELARATDIPHPSIIRFKRGESTIHLDAADKIAAHFGLELKPADKRRRSK